MSGTASSRGIEKKEGFAHVAQWIALDSDNETSIYRKFGELSARNLLYLQSELAFLEKQLGETDKIDAESKDVDVKDVASNWEVLVERHAQGDQQARTRMDLIAKIREKLKEYHDALFLQNEIAKLRRPRSRALEAYRHWFYKPVPVLGGQGKTFLNHKDDLVGLGTALETDYLSLFLRKCWPVQKELARDGSRRIGRFSEKSISAAVATINTVIIALLLIGPITSLYFIKDDGVKLGMIAAFTAAFALAIRMVTNARRAEIFAGTAAYAAVLVVFVSGNITKS